MSIVFSGASASGRAVPPVSLPKAAPEAAHSAMQVRRFSLVQKSSGEGGEPCGREVRVAQALDRARLAMKCAGHPQDPAVEPGAMNVVFTTPSAALAASLQSLSEGVQAMLSTHDPGGRLFGHRD